MQHSLDKTWHDGQLILFIIYAQLSYLNHKKLDSIFMEIKIVCYYLA